MKLKIGDFARLGQVSVQTIRYYDNLGLLKPCEVDPFTNYRYYSLKQLPKLVRILSYKDLGFSLEQISNMLAEDLPASELRRLLLSKQNELREQVQENLDRLERIESRLRRIEQDNSLSTYDVILKSVKPLRVVSLRGTVSSFWDASPLWMKFVDILNRNHIKPQLPSFTLCHATDPGIDIEVCFPIGSDVKECDGINISVLPAETMACTIHNGPFGGLITAFTSLIKWIDDNNYSIAGPDREIYLQLPKENQFSNDPNAITELQIPVHRMN
jgi:DNA-binding transcriptional MerR regulator/effector-binding domain-containing protein